MKCAALLVLLSLAAAGAEPLWTVEYKPSNCDSEPKSKPGDTLSMHYDGYIAQSSATGTPGQKFDSSRDRGHVFNTVIGVGQVIKGWDEGLLDMCVGEKRKLIVPPELGYGASGAGGGIIPGGATLRFDVECMGISQKAPQPWSPGARVHTTHRTRHSAG